MFDAVSILPILLFSVVIHELAHGCVALWLGDPTARDQGRLTLNPIPHIDPIGSVIIPLFSLLSAGQVFIAWAKPVPVNAAYFSRVRRDDILVSIAGPASNLVMALVCALLVIGVANLPAGTPQSLHDRGLRFLMKMFSGGISLNVLLAVFNMIPIPPLDGSHVVASLLPPAASLTYRRVGFYGIFLIMLLLQWGPFARMLSAVIDFLTGPIHTVVRHFV